MDIVYLDLETTGVEYWRHTIFEIGLIFPGGREYEIWIQPTADELAIADTNALRVNNYNRLFQDRESGPWHSIEGGIDSYIVRDSDRKRGLAAMLARKLDSVLLAGCNVKFDQEFLEAWLRRYGACPTWDYHVLDIPTYAAGVYNAKTRHVKKGASLGLIPPPFSTRKLGEAFKIPEPEEAHTALGDARWGKQLYEAAVSEIQ